MQGMRKKANSNFLKVVSLKPNYPRAKISLAISAWIDGDIKACKEHLDFTFNRSNKSGKNDFKFVVPFKKFLDMLVKYRENYPSEYLVNDVPPPRPYMSLVTVTPYLSQIQKSISKELIVGPKQR